MVKVKIYFWSDGRWFAGTGDFKYNFSKKFGCCNILWVPQKIAHDDELIQTLVDNQLKELKKEKTKE